MVNPVFFLKITGTEIITKKGPGFAGTGIPVGHYESIRSFTILSCSYSYNPYSISSTYSNSRLIIFSRPGRNLGTNFPLVELVVIRRRNVECLFIGICEGIGMHPNRTHLLACWNSMENVYAIEALLLFNS